VALLNEDRSMSVADRLQTSLLEAPIHAAGKFFRAGTETFWLRGVTYGTFRPTEDGSGYRRDAVECDFGQMAAIGINVVRVYTVPPRWMLDCAARHGLRLLVGLPWEQHLTFLDEPGRARDILNRLETEVRGCAGHPAIFAYAVGNEIPATIVRWYGAERIERWIERLCTVVKRVDPAALVTYVNYPSTEYLQLPFLDFLAFNVYLEQRDRLAAYVARLQNLAGNRPLVLAEIGLDSQRNGLEAQAASLEWQLETVFAGGCAGAFVYAWTDEWFRGGTEIEDWDFGLVTRERVPKPALHAVERSFREIPFPPGIAWPSISVVVCTHNGARTLHDCLSGLAALTYPDFEVLLVDDGSTDATAAIASEYDVTVISTPNRGLSAARTLGAERARGEIVAYLDDDARPDPDWLHFLAWSFLTTDHAVIGGPNIPPDGDGPIAFCVANAPGGPVHVLLTDEVAEHVPGCNLAVRRDRLLAIGGFDPRFRAAGDDVDFCWRIQDQGWTVGFHPGAMVWHHRRNSLKAYWNQQKGYGKAEALLEAKWPDRYNALGHLYWSGRLYGTGWTRALWGRAGRIYHGTWGQAPFQSLYDANPPLLAMLPLMPEWWLAIGLLAAISLLGISWPPLLLALPLLVLALLAPVAQAWVSTRELPYPAGLDRFTRLRLRLLTTGLHVAQPIARLRGRLAHGLTPWRARGVGGYALPVATVVNVWSDQWRSPETWIGNVERSLRTSGAVVRTGGVSDRWDLELRGGLAASARLLQTVEDHKTGQMAHFRVWPRFSASLFCFALALAALGAAAALRDEWLVALFLCVGGLAMGGWLVTSASSAMCAMKYSIARGGHENES
jgi:GT2 family glycosyltransferase